jgi:hypothetical protein
MAARVKHLMLTRFNVASPGREQAIRLKPGWLDGRFELFRKLCLPGVASQTRQDFDWFIFFDEQTPDRYRDEIARLQAIYPFHAEFTPLFEMEQIVPHLLQRGESAEWLLTTRLDSDDVLAIDHVSRLRELVETPKHQVINFRRGAILSIKSDQPQLYRVEDEANPFASLMEPLTAEASTIWAAKHEDIERIGAVRQVDGAPAWLQVVHGGNVSNRVKGVRVPVTSLTEAFPYLATLGAVDEKPHDILFSNSVIGPVRHGREIARAALKRAYHLVKR